ncbi:MAG TPA: hypothetical protein VG605_02390 [Puia sp.]|nr:hypothetical protein [Puia sp.]
MRKFSLTFFLGCVLVATIFFDDPHLFFYKRIIYCVFMGISLYQLYLFYFKRPAQDTDIEMPAWYKPWMYMFSIFIAYNLLVDVRNPAFSLVTELNHPLAALAVVPILAFRIGYQQENERQFVRFLLGTGILFCFFFVFPIQGKNIYTQGLACCYAVIPLAIFAIIYRKYRLFVLLLIVLSFIFSQQSESRTIILRILLFFGLMVAMNFVKRWRPLKLIVIVITAYFVYQFLTNLGSWLELFKDFVHDKSFDDEDTRTFLFNEVFGDMNTRDLIFGRGFQGNYFSPYFLFLETTNHDFSGDFYYRFSVEVGFLECLLKGGFIFFFLFVTPMVMAIYRGLFTRHNSRTAYLISIYILAEFLILFVENIPSYHFQFFLIFFLAGYCCRLTKLHQVLAYEDLHYNAVLQSGALY